MGKINWAGWTFVVAGLLIYYFRPLQGCPWYSIFCNAGSMIVTPLFLLISIIFVIVGAYKLLK